ncbi:sugar phosphate isomerase/epimerase family protein [Chitinophaga arvensicola]|uniref:Sugar phosphate isomerase/epimerase n=1 Tax=Chitinophaga arvensicola TaxID=29529 RepID=A0A1I0R426_9BACT|nr:sugar phosphate isomerase/epimerase [Chitinophaga arvensicola]SEW35273.1 Sugar phosphate isomerase/epimerase [Chitinophaga arvensicola]
MHIHRRTFIQQAGLLTTGLFLGPSLSTGKLPETGLQLWTLKDDLAKDLEGTIKKIAAAGYTDLETFGGGDQFFGLSPVSFKQLLDRHKLHSSSGHYYFPGDNESFDTVINGFIKAAKILGQTYIVIPSLPAALYSTAAGCKTAAVQLNRAGQLCKDAGLQLAYHNHAFEFQQFGTQTGYDILLKETAAGLVKMELDLYFAVSAGLDPVALFMQEPERFVMWHVKDMDKINPALNTEVGSGSIDFKRIFSYAKLAGVKRYFIEQENFAIDPYVSLKKSAQYFKTALIR